MICYFAAVRLLTRKTVAGHMALSVEGVSNPVELAHVMVITP